MAFLSKGAVLSWLLVSLFSCDDDKFLTSEDTGSQSSEVVNLWQGIQLRTLHLTRPVLAMKPHLHHIFFHFKPELFVTRKFLIGPGKNDDVCVSKPVVYRRIQFVRLQFHFSLYVRHNFEVHTKTLLS